MARRVFLLICTTAAIAAAFPCFAFSVTPAKPNPNGSPLVDPDAALDRALPLNAGVRDYQARPTLAQPAAMTIYDLSARNLKSTAGAATDDIARHSDDPRYNPFAALRAAP